MARISYRRHRLPLGSGCNLAARLCAEAKDGQILVSRRIAEAVEAVATLEDLGNLELKGLRRPVAAFNVTELISGASSAPDPPRTVRGTRSAKYRHTIHLSSLGLRTAEDDQRAGVRHPACATFEDS